MTTWGKIILMLSLFLILSCGLGDKYSGTWFNEKVEKEIVTIKKNNSGYTIDAGFGSFPCVKEGDMLKCKMGFGDAVLNISQDNKLIMTTPVGVQYKFKRKK